MKFISDGKNIIFSYINKRYVFAKTASSGGMTLPIAVSVCANLNRFLAWVEQNPPMGESENDKDIDYFCAKLVNLADSLHLNRIKSIVAELILLGEFPDSVSAKRAYFVTQMDEFAKDTRMIGIVDRYTHANLVDNMKETDKTKASSLTNYELYTMCMMFTFSRIYFISYLTVMSDGDYFEMSSASICGSIDNKGLLDMLFDHTITVRYPNNIGLLGQSFMDRIIIRYISSFIDNKVKTSKLLSKFAIMGINNFSIYTRVCTEIFGGLHRVFPKEVDVAEGEEEIKRDNFQDGDDPSNRKYFLLGITKYIGDTLTSILKNTIDNVKPKYSIRVEGSDDNAEKDVFDSSIHENKEAYKFALKIKRSIFTRALSNIDSGTLELFDEVHVSKHILGKFILSFYMDIAYNTSEPLSYLTYEEYKVVAMHAYTLMEDYPELRMALMGKMFTRQNNVEVTIKDFPNGIPHYMANNANKCIKILNNLVKTQYRTEIKIHDKIHINVYSIKDELLRFLENVHEVFGSISKYDV